MQRGHEVLGIYRFYKVAGYTTVLKLSKTKDIRHHLEDLQGVDAGSYG